MSHRLRVRAWLAFVLIGMVAPLHAQERSDDLPIRIDAPDEARQPIAVGMRVAIADFPGAAFVIRDREGRTWSGAVGFADRESGLAFTPQTEISLYSVTKPMTAALAFRLVEQGRLDLDRPISSYAQVPAAYAGLTARELMGHTGGVRHYQRGEWFGVSRRPCTAPEQALAPFVRSAPGPRGVYLYSSFGYVLLSHVVEGAGGASFASLLRENVLSPSQIEGAGLWPPGMRRPPHGYERSGDAFTAARAIDNSCKFGGGALVGSAEDLARFGVALGTRRIVSDASFRAITASTDGRNGLGLSVGRLEDGTPVAMHSGSAIGGTSALIIDLETGLSVGAVANAEGPSLMDEAMQLLLLARRSGAFAPRP